MMRAQTTSDIKEHQSAYSSGAKKVHQGGKFLTFFLDKEEYGIEILKVQEIIGMMPITPVPKTPEFIRGVINLRGKIIPIVDLRLKFGMEAKEVTDQTCIIVVQAKGVQMGLVVDKVSEVADISNEDIEECPSFGTNVNTDFILGMGIGRTDGRVKMLLDIDKVLSFQEVVDMNSAVNALKQDKEHNDNKGEDKN